MKKQELVDFEITICSKCNGKGKYEDFSNEEAIEREIDKLPSGYLAYLSSISRGFINEVNCNVCDGSGEFWEPIFD
ncbi:hypothetical protein [Schinkia azotoformans]|uniref:hypothetical protein n=1 Tax=Schinkia azotoformans TaxID=1454 RepID=UPI002DB9EA18|nr:hypothetical protein [Schinkia azotoformans]MEC1782108.1 hypothetical protein [Schinkia azotoformans]MED4329574.1 hypothetical protein [Schinkia azotoformans]